MGQDEALMQKVVAALRVCSYEVSRAVRQLEDS